MEFFSGSGGDPLKPSIFELVAQEQLRDLLQPALKYVLAVFAQRYPRYLLRIVNRHEEFYAAIMLVVERYYLRKHNASFAENFYGMKRRRRPYIETERARLASGTIPPAEKLRNREIRLSLFYLVCTMIYKRYIETAHAVPKVAIPYIRAKAHDYFEELGGGAHTDLLDDESEAGRSYEDESWPARLRRAYTTIYPWANSAFEVWLLISNVAYLFDQTPYYRPWLSWIGVDLRRLGPEDYRAAMQPKPTAPDRRRSLHARLRRLLLTSPRLLLDSLRLLLPTAIFFVKFLEWWYAPGSPARALAAAPRGPAVPPPRMLAPHPQGIPFDPAGLGTCPLCRAPVSNATALPSGYVFCYRCAYDEVEKHGRCPVTLLPARVWQLRKVLV
ncbi:Pex12 amino terminal region-domain-containing protein [Schizophyllum amplum]|uniref:Peroxisome assembly protein 12 n=1 Tax=Schizophyllum amplum TaxID=97359 RepID=A0A550CUH9_9AGAR|nr:Pex12 amino terminal region-domain-containing protein [Auriculariopsis ampla]